MKILAIESSCDESAVAIFNSQTGIEQSLIHSQIDLHALYGGVVPDLASSEHLKKLPILIEAVSQTIDLNTIDIVAVTSGPGLPNCLAMGVASASALAMTFNKKLVGINHLNGHAYSPFIDIHTQDPKNFSTNFANLLPHLGLTVSGGNTILFEINTNYSMRVIAETIDDAAGEALDKGAKLLGIQYPGAPIIEKYARNGIIDKTIFPYGQNRKIQEDPNFSFSGLKTSLRYYLEKLTPQQLQDNLPNICASYQYAVVEQLRRRTDFFAKQKRYASIGISGGVSNNTYFADTFNNLAKKHSAKFLIADKKYRGDNAAMIAFAAFVRPEYVRESKFHTLPIEPAWEIV